MADWPSQLPGIRLQGCNYRQLDQTLRTQMDSGRYYVRPRYTGAPVRVRCGFVMTAEQLQIFQAWWVYYADRGAAYFMMPITDAIGTENQRCRFWGSYSWVQLSSGAKAKWRMNCTIELEKLRILTKAELDRIIAGQSGFGSFTDSFTDSFDIV